MLQNLGDAEAYRLAVDEVLGVLRADFDGRLGLLRARQVCDQVLAHYRPFFSVSQISVMVYRAMLDQGVDQGVALAVVFDLFEGV
jgi:hypothetical protein